MGMIQDLLSGNNFQSSQRPSQPSEGIGPMLAFLSRGRQPAAQASMQPMQQASIGELAGILQAKRNSSNANEMAMRKQQYAENNPKIQSYIGGVEGQPTMRQVLDKVTGKPLAGSVPYGQSASAVTVNTGDTSSGRYLSDAEKASQGFSKDDTVWMNPKTGPKIVGGRNAIEVAAGVTAGSIKQRLEGMNEVLGKFTPSIRDSLDQFGIPEAFANLVRTPKGRAYNTTMKSITADVIKIISGTAASDQEKADLRSIMAYTPGDTAEDLQYKTQQVMQRIDDIKGLSGVEQETVPKVQTLKYDGTGKTDAQVAEDYRRFIEAKNAN